MASVMFRELRQLLPVPVVVARQGYVIHREGAGRLRSGCPIHGSTSRRSRSLSLSAEGWYCYVCRRGGDVVDLWAALTGLAPHPAALDLCRAFGVRPPWTPRRRRGEQEEARCGGRGGLPPRSPGHVSQSRPSEVSDGD